MKKVAKVALAGLALLLVAQVSQGEDQVPHQQKEGPHGAEVFRLNCSACHGPQAAGTQLAPRIDDVLPRLGEAKVREVLETGRKVMPSMAHLKPVEIDAVLSFLEGPAKAVQTTTPTKTLTKPNASIGQLVFQSNCASCHSTTPAVAPKPGPASLVNVTKRFSAKEIENIMRNGVCYMPSFDHFSAAEAQSVVAYLGTLEDDSVLPIQGGCGSCDKVAKAARTAPLKAGAKKAGCEMDGKGCGMKAKQAGCEMGGKGCDMKAKKAGCEMGGEGCDMEAKKAAAKKACCDMKAKKASTKKAGCEMGSEGCDMKAKKAAANQG